jgi:chromosome partitioning protein
MRPRGKVEPMKVISFVTQKGGTGKTTLAASFAVAAQEAGERVFVIDMDEQASLMAWGHRRQADEPAIDRTTPDKLPAVLTALQKAGYTLAVIDTQGHDSAGNSAAMRSADLCLIPATPSVMDIEAAKPTVGALTRLGRPFAFVLNRCPAARVVRMQDAARAVSLLGALAEPLMVQRTDHVDAMGFGIGVTEHDPSGKAAEEVRKLWSWAKNRMKDTSHGQTARIA